MASIIISGNTLKDVPEINKMVNELLNGRISMSRFIKFLDDNNLETRVRCVNKDINPSVLDDFIGDTLSTIFSVPKKSEHEYAEENDEYEEVEDDECKNPDELWKKTNEAYEKHIKDTVDFAKRLIDDYGDSEEDDIDHTKAVKLFHSMMILGRTYRQRANKGDERYNIPNFTPENILKFIESLGLPTDKIQAALERGRSSYYKMKIYKDFEEFEKNMKEAYNIQDVWNPPKEVPEWFESVRNMQYRKFYPIEDILIDESEWIEFMKWKENKSKSSTSKKTASSSKKDESTSKKTESSASAKKEKTIVKKTTVKSKTDVKLKEFKKYADYILSNSIVKNDARDLLISYAANLDERCKKLYDYLVELKKKNKVVKLIKFLDDKTGNEDIGFIGIED